MNKTGGGGALVCAYMSEVEVFGGTTWNAGEQKDDTVVAKFRFDIGRECSISQETFSLTGLETMKSC